MWAALATQSSGRPHPDPGSQCPAGDTETDTKSPKGSQWYFFIISSFCFIFSFAKSAEKEAVSAWQASTVLGVSPRLCWEDSQSSLGPATSQEGTRLGRQPQSLTQAAGSRGQRSRQPHAACGRLEEG